jgi:2'-5' RNA ligase
VRLFVAVEVPADAREAIDRIERPPGDDVRWSDPASWHVTLRFLGEVGELAAAAAVAALEAVDAAAGEAVVGRVPARVGRVAIALPVAGIDEIAAGVATAFAGLPGEEARRFRGHLTVGRLRRVGRWPAAGVGSLPAEVGWPVTSVALVRSHLGGGRPARYEVLARQSLRGA